MSYPSVVQVETTSYCQADCIFCVHGRMPKYETMTLECYKKIILELAKWPEAPKCFIPMLTGEPFCDRDIMEKILYARRWLPYTQIILFTNGGLIKDNDIKMLADVKGLRVFLSLNALCPETRMRLMKVDDYYRAFTNYFKLLNAGVDVIASMVDHPNIPRIEKEAFYSSIGITFTYQNWAGLLPFATARNGVRGAKMTCSRALEHMTILADGTANLCCFDPFGRKDFGNVNTATLYDIWNSEERQYIATCHANGEGQLIDICRDCTEPYSGKEE